MTEKFIRRDEVIRLTGLQTSTIYEMMASGAFPKNVRIAPRLCVWRETEIAAWQKARIAERDAALAPAAA
jgi:prophage regulatory protein